MSDGSSHAALTVTGAVVLGLSLLVTPPGAEAGNDKAKGGQDEGQGQGQGRGKATAGAVTAGQAQSGTSDEELLQRGIVILAEVLFTDRERRIIREAFSDGYPAGFDKPKPVPPGIRKKLARGGTVPPGIAKTRMPASVLDRLPRREGERIVIIDRDVYLIRKTTELILDVLENVL